MEALKVLHRCISSALLFFAILWLCAVLHRYVYPFPCERMDRTSTSLSGAIELTRIFGMPSDTLKLSAVHPLTKKGIALLRHGGSFLYFSAVAP